MITSVAGAASKGRQTIRHSMFLSEASEAYVIFLYIIPTAQDLHTSKIVAFPKRVLHIFTNFTVCPRATRL